MSENSLLELLKTDVVAAAQRMLGATLVRGELRARIVETEAYRASDDPACPAYKGATDRNRVMFETVGCAYVYFSYGCHWMLNVTAHEHNDAAAVLIRAAQPLSGLEEMRRNRMRPGRLLQDRDLLSGPGKLAQAFGIDRSLNGLDLFAGLDELSIECATEPASFATGVRVGIAQGKGHDLTWRFISLDGTHWASKPKLDLKT